MIQSAALRILKDQANIIVLCQEAATEVFERHYASFKGFIRCPKAMRRDELFNSINGDWDYNWIVNGKDCINYKIGYPKTVETFKKENVESMFKDICDDYDTSSTDTDDISTDSESESESDDGVGDIEIPTKKYKGVTPVINLDEIKDKYAKDHKIIQQEFRKRKKPKQ